MTFRKLIRSSFKNILFTTPSHAQKFFLFKKFRHVYKYDVSETDTHSPQEMLYEAESNASKIYGTKQTKFLTNGSSSGIIGAVLSCVNEGDKVLVWRNAHRCHHNAIKLAGAIPVYYDLPLNEFGVTTSFTNPEKYLDKSIKAIIVTSPTYEGLVKEVVTPNSLRGKS